MSRFDRITAGALGALILGLSLWVITTLAAWATAGATVTAGILR